MRLMKDSGIEWIKEIPESWDVARGKTILSLMKRSPDGFDEVITCFRDGEVTLRSNRRKDGFTFSDKEIGYQGILKGDLVIHGMDGFAGAIGIADANGKGSPVLVVCTTNENSRFLMYYLRMLATQDVFLALATGIRERSCDLRWNKIADLLFPVPLYDEQTRIADYLDAKCAKIDALIAKQQEIIEKLKAYKLSVITEAVTKGLNPNVPMKDCGIEWIGVIPEQWRLSHIGNLAEIGAGGTPDRKKPEYWEDGTIRWMASGEINYEYVYDTAERITELGIQNSNAKLLPVNTVMLGLIGQGKTKGMTAILKTECACNQNLAYLIPNPDLLHYRYLFYCFKAMYHYIRGLVGESQAGIYQDFLKKQHIPLPNIEVQVEICDYLDRVAAAIDIYVVRREEQIKKLVDYKKSLIYEVVTGKREV